MTLNELTKSLIGCYKLLIYLDNPDNGVVLNDKLLKKYGNRIVDKVFVNSRIDGIVGRIWLKQANDVTKALTWLLKGYYIRRKSWPEDMEINYSDMSNEILDDKDHNFVLTTDQIFNKDGSFTDDWEIVSDE